MVHEGFFLAILVFGPLAFGAVEFWSIALLEIVIFVLFARSYRPAFKPPICRSFLPAMLFILLLGILQRLNPVAADGVLPFWTPFTTAPHDTGTALLLWTAYTMFVFCATRILAGEDACRRFLWTVFLLGVVIAVVGIIQKAHGDTHFYGLREMGRWRRPFGPYANHNHAASLMAMAACMGGGLWLSRFFQRREDGIGPLSDLIASQALAFFLLLILVAGIIQSNSRGGWLSLILTALLIAFLACSFIRGRFAAWGARALLAGAAVAAAVYLISSGNLHRIAPLSTENSVTYRINMYRGGWEMFLDAPLFGNGFGALRAFFPAYQAASIDPYVMTHVHCDWLELLAETGLAGFIVYAAGLVFFLIGACRAWLALPGRSSRCMAGGVLAAAVCFILHCFVDFPFHIPANAVIFLAALAWLGGPVLHPSDQPDAPKPGRPLRIAAYALSCFLIVLSVRPAIAAFYGRAAQKADLAARPYYLTMAARWSGSPGYPFQLAATYLQLADENPLAQSLLLRQALVHSTEALKKEALNVRYSHLQGLLLWKLGRKRDARPLLRETKLHPTAP